MSENYDLVIIGAGPAGYTAAEEAARKGFRTALIENRELGGTCLNRGCIPTKTLLHSAALFSELKNHEALGLRAEHISCDMERLQERKEAVTGQLRSGIAMMMKKNRVTVLQGMGTILAPHEVRVSGGDEKVLHTRYILAASGSVPALPPVPGIHLPGVMTSDELLSEKKLYPRLTIIGGGVIGMEFASIYSSLGAKVTVIEFLDRILANMDREISQNLKMILKKRGVEIHTGARVEEILRREDGTMVCRYMEKETLQEAESDAVLAAAGRRAFTEGILGENMKLEMDRGRILVNEYGQTSAPDIYAAGDVTGGIQLAHAATAHALNAVAHMAGEKAVFSTETIPGCVYTDPEIASVGLTQEEAKAQGIEVLCKKYPMSANGKTVLTGQDRGFIKVVAEAGTHRILGAQMMCARATDMISEFGTAVVHGLTMEEMAAVIRPHPTFSEGITEALR